MSSWPAVNVINIPRRTIRRQGDFRGNKIYYKRSCQILTNFTPFTIGFALLIASFAIALKSKAQLCSLLNRCRLQKAIPQRHLQRVETSPHRRRQSLTPHRCRFFRGSLPDVAVALLVFASVYNKMGRNCEAGSGTGITNGTEAPSPSGGVALRANERLGVFSFL